MDVGTQQQSETWIEARGRGIGGSDAAAILGVNPWCSPYTLWCRKAGLIEGPRQNEAMRWGHRLETAVFQWYEEETERRASVPGAMRWSTAGPFILEKYPDGVLLRSNARPWQTATPDGILAPIAGAGDSRGILEIKCVSDRRKSDWADGVPAYVRAQVLHYMSVTGYTWGSVAVLFGGNDPGWMDIFPEDGELERLVATETAFWESLQRGEPPPADGSESTRDALAELYPKPEKGASVALPDEALQWDAEFAEHKRLEKFHRDKARGFETQIRAAMGSAEQATLPSGVTWRSTRVEDSPVEAHVRKGYRKYTRREPRPER